MIKNKKIIKKFVKVLALYGVQIWVVLFVANVAFISFIRFKAQAQSCLTRAQIDADSRCLYIVDGNIYKKGTKPNKHHGHACGSDVTNTIPSYHINSASKYMLPNFVGPVCTDTQPTPVPTPTRTPTQVPTNTPTIRPTQAPTAVPTRTPTQPPQPTATPAPNATATAAVTAPPTQIPGQTRTPTAAPRRTPTRTPTAKFSATTPNPQTPTIEPTPIATSPLFAIMASLANTSPTPNLNEETVVVPFTNTENVIEKEESPGNLPSANTEKTYSIIYWSTLFSYVSFLALLITGGVWLVQQIKAHLKSPEQIKPSA